MRAHLDSVHVLGLAHSAGQTQHNLLGGLGLRAVTSTGAGRGSRSPRRPWVAAREALRVSRAAPHVLPLPLPMPPPTLLLLLLLPLMSVPWGPQLLPQRCSCNAASQQQPCIAPCHHAISARLLFRLHSTAATGCVFGPLAAAAPCRRLQHYRRCSMRLSAAAAPRGSPARCASVQLPPRRAEPSSAPAAPPSCRRQPSSAPPPPHLLVEHRLGLATVAGLLAVVTTLACGQQWRRRRHERLQQGQPTTPHLRPPLPAASACIWQCLQLPAMPRSQARASGAGRRRRRRAHPGRRATPCRSCTA